MMDIAMTMRLLHQAKFQGKDYLPELLHRILKKWRKERVAGGGNQKSSEDGVKPRGNLTFDRFVYASL
jgi:hypothetical protein